MSLSHRLGLAALLAALLAFAATAFPQSPAPARGPEKTVRMIYLVSRDRQPRADYQLALDRAIRDLQLWYGRQMNGATFKLHNPVVDRPRRPFYRPPSPGMKLQITHHTTGAVIILRAISHRSLN